MSQAIKLKVVGFGEEFTLRVERSGTKKKLKEVTTVQSVHEGCGGRISMTMACKECGEVFPRTSLADNEGTELVIQSPIEGAYFEVVGFTRPETAAGFKWADAFYLAEVDKSRPESADLSETLFSQDKALIGYTRFRGDYEERPAVLFVPEAGTLAFATLFFADAEATKPIPIFDKTLDPGSSRFGPLLEELGATPPASLVRRDPERLVKKADVQEA